VSELPEGRREREDGNLDHVIELRVVVNPAQRIGVDQILGVMGQNHVEADTVFLFVQEHALINPIEIIGFRSGAAVRNECQMYVRVAFHGLFDRRDGEGVVRIGAEEEFEARILQLRKVVIDHLLDDLVFLPERHENRHPAGRGSV